MTAQQMARTAETAGFDSADYAFAGARFGLEASEGVFSETECNPLRVGSAVNIRGKLINTEKPYSIPAVLVTTDAGDPAVFNQKPR